ncbi:MAG: SMC-Scp complex subunit ScpB [Patescibacteria group bacterium]|nr:SMC-Scp complex subunit ScpB [Patescibacteria group bacterium]
MEPQHLKSVLESLLFIASKPLSLKELSKFLEEPPEAVQAGLETLILERKDSGIVVLESNGTYQMSTNTRNSTQVKNFLNAELREKLTDATVEVLGIIAYRQPISKAEIEAIRGVNSQYSLRHLLMRGLIEKISNPRDARSLYYQTTTEFLQHLGLSSVKELPSFEELVGQIKLPETPALENEALAAAQPTAAENPAPEPEPLAAAESATEEEYDDEEDDEA